MIFCSTIIPTIGRDSLSKAVDSVLSQEVDAEHEIIIVNDSGRSLPPAAWQRSGAARVIETNRRERSVARNTGAAIARGRYLHFLDDDDWLLPGALHALRKAAEEAPEAGWIYGGVDFVDPAGRRLGRLNLGRSGNCFVQTIAAVWIPLQASLIRTDAFFAAGGFDPQLTVNEDLDLCRRVALRDDFGHTPATVACILRGPTWGSATDAARALGSNRGSRDRALNKAGALRRLRASADGSGFWHGRAVHAYAGAALRHARERRPAKAASRALFAVAALLLAGRYVASGSFWRALRTDTVTHDLIEEATPRYEAVSEWMR